MPNTLVKFAPKVHAQPLIVERTIDEQWSVDQHFDPASLKTAVYVSLRMESSGWMTEFSCSENDIAHYFDAAVKLLRMRSRHHFGL